MLEHSSEIAAVEALRGSILIAHEQLRASPNPEHFALSFFWPVVATCCEEALQYADEALREHEWEACLNVLRLLEAVLLTAPAAVSSSTSIKDASASASPTTTFKVTKDPVSWLVVNSAECRDAVQSFEARAIRILTEFEEKRGGRPPSWVGVSQNFAWGVLRHHQNSTPPYPSAGAHRVSPPKAQSTDMFSHPQQLEQIDVLSDRLPAIDDVRQYTAEVVREQKVLQQQRQEQYQQLQQQKDDEQRGRLAKTVSKRSPSPTAHHQPVASEVQEQRDDRLQSQIRQQQQTRKSSPVPTTFSIRESSTTMSAASATLLQHHQSQLQQHQVGMNVSPDGRTTGFAPMQMPQVDHPWFGRYNQERRRAMKPLLVSGQQQQQRQEEQEVEASGSGGKIRQKLRRKSLVASFSVGDDAVGGRRRRQKSSSAATTSQQHEILLQHQRHNQDDKDEKGNRAGDDLCQVDDEEDDDEEEDFDDEQRHMFERRKQETSAAHQGNLNIVSATSARIVQQFARRRISVFVVQSRILGERTSKYEQVPSISAVVSEVRKSTRAPFQTLSPHLHVGHFTTPGGVARLEQLKRNRACRCIIRALKRERDDRLLWRGAVETISLVDEIFARKFSGKTMTTTKPATTSTSTAASREHKKETEKSGVVNSAASSEPKTPEELDRERQEAEQALVLKEITESRSRPVSSYHPQLISTDEVKYLSKKVAELVPYASAYQSNTAVEKNQQQQQVPDPLSFPQPKKLSISSLSLLAPRPPEDVDEKVTANPRRRRSSVAARKSSPDRHPPDGPSFVFNALRMVSLSEIDRVHAHQVAVQRAIDEEKEVIRRRELMALREEMNRKIVAIQRVQKTGRGYLRRVFLASQLNAFMLTGKSMARLSNVAAMMLQTNADSAARKGGITSANNNANGAGGALATNSSSSSAAAQHQARKKQADAAASRQIREMFYFGNYSSTSSQDEGGEAKHHRQQKIAPKTVQAIVSGKISTPIATSTTFPSASDVLDHSRKSASCSSSILRHQPQHQHQAQQQETLFAGGDEAAAAAAAANTSNNNNNNNNNNRTESSNVNTNESARADNDATAVVINNMIDASQLVHNALMTRILKRHPEWEVSTFNKKRHNLIKAVILVQSILRWHGTFNLVDYLVAQRAVQKIEKFWSAHYSRKRSLFGKKKI